MTLDGSDLAVLVPLWRRTTNLPRLLGSVRATVPRARVVLVASLDDLAARRYLTRHRQLIDVVDLGIGPLDHDREYPVWFDDPLVEVLAVGWPGGSRGDYARKINAGYTATDEPVLFTGADDLECHDGWYEAARPLLDVPDEVLEVMPSGGVLIGPGRVPRVGVVGTNDLSNPRTMSGEHSTHSLVARWYADQGGMPERDHVVYNEGYWHEYCDDELVQVAMSRGAWAHAPDAHVEHHHPIAGKAPDDDTYRRGRERSRASRRLFLQRQRARLWGPQRASSRRVYRGV